MAEEILLIGREDIEKVYPIGKSINDDRLDTYIRRAQHSDLTDFLGEQMYWVLFEDAGEQEIVDLRICHKIIVCIESVGGFVMLIAQSNDAMHIL